MIYINDIPSFRDPDRYKVIPDDRVQKIEIINSVAVQDYGHISDGDAFSLVCMFSEENFARFLALWEARTKVTFTDTKGVTYQNLRIVITEYEPDKDYPEYTTVTFELWRK